MTSFTPTPGSAALWIYGAGGHGLVVAEAAAAAGWRVAGFIDDRLAGQPGAPPEGHRVLGLPVRAGSASAPPEAGAVVIIAVGDNATRQRLQELVAARGAAGLATVVHPRAWVSPSAALGPGVYVGPMAVINALAQVGPGAIVNSGAIIEHHNHIAAFAHIAPGAVLAGRVNVGERALVGAGASVRPGVTIGRDCVVGAGAAVVRDVPDGATVTGVPAR